MGKRRSIRARFALWLLKLAEARALRAHGYRRQRSHAQALWLSPDGDLLVHDRAVSAVKRGVAWRNSAGLRCVQ